MSPKVNYSHQAKRILQWNANGLLGKKFGLSQFFVSEEIDIALITETHLTSRTRADI